jgi:hypothetical protein
MTQVSKKSEQTETVEEGKVEAMNAGKQTHGLSLVEQNDDNAMGEKINTQPPPDTPFNPDNLTNLFLCIDELNKRYALVNAGNKIVVVDEYADGLCALTKQAFFDLYANKSVSVGKTELTAAQHWFKSPNRRQYLDGFVFDPSCSAPPGKYNLWRGFDVEPDSSKSCQRLLTHLQQIICDEDKVCYEYFLDWLALLVQKPDQLPGVAICLISEQGSGKGVTLKYIGKLFGRHYKQINNKSQLLGKFTGQLEDAVLVFADELHWENDSKAETGMLKGLITEETRMMERKYAEPIPVKNCVHLVIASNEPWAIPAELGDRRFFVLQASSATIGDTRYFSDIVSEMDDGGSEALLAHLLNRDISSFVPGKFPKTAARVSQQLASLKPIEAWLYEVADSGEASGIDQSLHGPWPDKVNKQLFHQAYCQWCTNNRTKHSPGGVSAFTATLNKFGIQPCKMPGDESGRRSPGYILPTVHGLRDAIDKALGYTAPWDPL